jgi:hypothetical protein
MRTKTKIAQLEDQIKSLREDLNNKGKKLDRQSKLNLELCKKIHEATYKPSFEVGEEYKGCKVLSVEARVKNVYNGMYITYPNEIEVYYEYELFVEKDKVKVEYSQERVNEIWPEKEVEKIIINGIY